MRRLLLGNPRNRQFVHDPQLEKRTHDRSFKITKIKYVFNLSNWAILPSRSPFLLGHPNFANRDCLVVLLCRSSRISSRTVFALSNAS